MFAAAETTKFPVLCITGASSVARAKYGVVTEVAEFHLCPKTFRVDKVQR